MKQFKVVTEEYESFPHERGKPDHLLICDQVQLVEYCIVFGKVLVPVLLLLTAKPRAIHCNKRGIAEYQSFVHISALAIHCNKRGIAEYQSFVHISALAIHCNVRE